MDDFALQLKCHGSSSFIRPPWIKKICKNQPKRTKNAVKTQCCLSSRRVDRNLPDISFGSNSLEFSDKLIRFQCWASLWGLIFLEIIISQPLLKLLRASLVSYLGLDAILLPVNFLHCIRLKFVPVSNMALICGEGPPSILLPHWMQFRSEQLN